MEFQFLFVVEVPEQSPIGNRELELKVRFGWNFSSCSCLGPKFDRGGGGGSPQFLFVFVFVVEVPEPPAGNRELELEGRFG